MNREELKSYPAHSMPQIQAPWQDAETGISAVSQEMGRVACMGEDPRGFLHYSQYGEDQRDKCRAELLTNAFAAAEQVLRDEHPHLHLQGSQGCCQHRAQKRGQ